MGRGGPVRLALEHGSSLVVGRVLVATGRTVDLSQRGFDRVGLDPGAVASGYLA